MKFLNKVSAIMISAMPLVSAVAGSNQIGAHLGGGLQSIQFKPEQAKHHMGFGGLFEADYRYFFNKNVGVGAGLGFSIFDSRTVMNGLQSEPRLDEINRTAEDEPMDYSYNLYFYDFEERQMLYQLDVPIGAYFKSSKGEKWNFYGGLGAKVSFPVGRVAKVKEGDFESKGFYPENGVEYSNLPQHGFKKYEMDFKEKYDAKMPNVSLFVDLGATRFLSYMLDLYVGLYGSYGLTDLNKTNGPLMVEQNGDFTYNGMLNSDNVNKFNTWSAGVKIGLLFNPGRQPAFVPQFVEDITPDTKLEEEKEPVDTVVAQNVVNIESEVADTDEDDNALFAANSKIRIKCIDKFEVGQSKLPGGTDTIVAALSVIKEDLINNPKMILMLVGHCSNEGGDLLNDQLGIERCFSIYQMLVKMGVPERQIKVKSKGKSEPKVPNTSKLNKSLNRRVEFYVKWKD